MDITNICKITDTSQVLVDEDLLASPPLHKIAKSIFDNPSDNLNNIIRNTVTEFNSNEVENSQDCDVILNNKVPYSPSNSSVSSSNQSSFIIGDIVWAQTDEQFPFWPAYLLDPNNLPEELKHTYQHSSKKKIPVYFYGRNDYDIVSTSRMKDYQKNKDQMKSQHISGNRFYYIIFKY